MTKHFATSWLQSLSAKLQALAEWSWTADKRGECTVHRNLFREFFSAQFGKTLALVDESKKTEFLGVIERNLYKFDVNTQQYPLQCLCALLQHGKESPKTQEKVVAWVAFLLDRLRRPAGGPGVPATVAMTEVVEECLSPQFQKFIPLMEDALRARLADGLGERLGELGEDVQQRVLAQLPAVPARVEEVVVTCTKELNLWIKTAPRFPATPLSLADTLSKMEHPLVKFFTAVKQPARKEAFLVATGLTLQSLRTRFRWMCVAEPELESLGAELQRKLFTVEGQGPVMEMWLSSRLTKYNTEVATRAAALVSGNPSLSERLSIKLEACFPKGTQDDEDAWLTLLGPTALATAVLDWIRENHPDFVCPEHTLAKETLMGVLNRFSHTFEVDIPRLRVRLRPLNSLIAPMSLDVQTLSQPPSQVLPQVPFPPPPPVMQFAASPMTSIFAPAVPVPPPVMKPPPGAPGFAALALLSGASVAPQPVAAPAASALALLPAAAATAAGAAGGGGAAAAFAASLMQLQVATPGAAAAALANEVFADNLVDLLMNEALEKLAPEVRIQINKVGHAVYRMGSKEVTLHTLNGRLYVYRIGEVVRNIPIETLFKEENLLPETPAPVATQSAAEALRKTTSFGDLLPAPLSGTSGSVDSSAVARITMQSKQISSGASSAAVSAAFAGMNSHFNRKPEALMSKRVEAATKAMNISKQIVRRHVNFDDEKLLRKLLAKGIKKEPQLKHAFQEQCANRGIAEADPKQLSRDFVVSFIENNLANSINEAWARKILYPPTDKEKKEKKDKKDKKKKDKKRKASDSSSSGGAGSQADDAIEKQAVMAPDPAGAAALAAGRVPGMPPRGGPGADPTNFGAAYGMPPFGMSMIGVPGPGGAVGAMPPGFDPGMFGMTDEQVQKKAKKEAKGDKPKKEKSKK